MTSKHLIVGMPGSGKSTFIAALRYLLVSAEIPTALSLIKLSSDETHLNRLEERWLASEQLVRTLPPDDAWVTFAVRDNKTGDATDLVLPDLPGEAFEQPATLGLCRKSLVEALIEADGLLLFTNANRADDGMLLSDVQDILDFGGASSAKPAPAKPFVAQAIPEEAKVVELLQAMNRRPCAPKLRRLAIVISAWDVVAPGATPAGWFAQHRPMLAQYLRSNPDLWLMRLYGVSAQGGVLPRDRDKLQAVRKPSERIIIAGDAAGAHDLTAPVWWLMQHGGE